MSQLKSIKLQKGNGAPDDSLESRIVGAMIGSCSCLTKTPEANAHSSLCGYRILSECLDWLQNAGPINRDNCRGAKL